MVGVNHARGAVLLLATVVNSVLLTLPQIVALVVLSPTNFGIFALFSLAASLNGLLLAALVVDPWLRSTAQPTDEGAFTGVAAVGATIGGAPATLCVLLATSELSLALLAFLASSLVTLRTCLRVRDVRSQRGRVVLLGDVLGVVSLVAVIGTYGADMHLAECLWLIISGQAAPLVVAALGSRSIRCHPLAWWRAHRDDIRLLAADSLWGAVSGVGAPYALLPILGLTDFGTYRAISNLAAPVRLIVQPLKPMLPRLVVPKRDIPGAASILALGFAMAALATGTLRVGIGDWADGSAIEALRVIAAPAGIYFGFNLVLQTYWARARLVTTRRLLRSTRRWHLAIASVLPLVGGASLGLHGAAWGLGGATALCAVAWWRANVVGALPDQSAM